MFAHRRSRCSIVGRVQWPGLQIAEESDQRKVRHDVERAVERERGR